MLHQQTILPLPDRVKGPSRAKAPWSAASSADRLGEMAGYGFRLSSLSYGG